MGGSVIDAAVWSHCQIFSCACRYCQCSIHIADIVIGSHIHCSVRYHCIDGHIAAGSYHCLASCHGHGTDGLTSCHCSACQAPAIVCQRRSIIRFAVTVCRDGDRPCCNGHGSASGSVKVVVICYPHIDHCSGCHVGEHRQRRAKTASTCQAVLYRISFNDSCYRDAVGGSVIDAAVWRDCQRYIGHSRIGYRDLCSPRTVINDHWIADLGSIPNC